MASSDQALQYLNSFAHIITRTQTKEIGLWGEKEFQRAVGWAKCIEQVAGTSSESTITKAVHALYIKTNLGFFSKVGYTELQSATVLLIKYILHSEFVDFNPRLMRMAIEYFQTLDSENRALEDIINDRIKVDCKYNEMVRAYESTQKLFEKYGGERKSRRGPTLNYLVSQENSTFFDVRTKTFPVINLLTEVDRNNRESIDIFADCIVRWVLEAIAKKGAENEQSVAMLEAVHRLYFPNSPGSNKQIQFCDAEDASALSDAYFPFASSYIKEVVIACKLIPYSCKKREAMNQGDTRVKVAEILPRFQSLMNRSSQLQIFCKAVIEKSRESKDRAFDILHQFL